MTTLKTCFKCKLEKPRSEFYRHPQMGDGLLGKCKACTRIDVRANYASRAEYYRAYDRSRTNTTRLAKAKQSYRKAWEWHPERRKAKTVTSNAIRDGRLKRQPCWVCGGKAEAHHADYSAPLDVVWLCRPHHMQAHAITRRID